jgi:RNA polymerase sigma factor (TIGR02999 family)
MPQRNASDFGRSAARRARLGEGGLAIHEASREDGTARLAGFASSESTESGGTVGSEITLLLRRMSAGDTRARDELYERVHARLRRMAQRHMRDQPAGHTLQATALLGEVYLRLSRQKGVTWEARGQFFAMAGRAMRSVLVDHARRKRRAKRSAPGDRVELDGVAVSFETRVTDLLDLDAALERLGAVDSQAARIVELRYFCGLDLDDVADAVGVSVRTVNREWRNARAWLRAELS